MKRLLSIGLGLVLGALIYVAPATAEAASATQSVSFRVVIPKLEPLRLDMHQQAQRLAVDGAESGDVTPGTHEEVDAYGRRQLRQTVITQGRVELILAAP